MKPGRPPSALAPIKPPRSPAPLSEPPAPVVAPAGLRPVATPVVLVLDVDASDVALVLGPPVRRVWHLHVLCGVVLHVPVHIFLLLAGPGLDATLTELTVAPFAV